jgi:hypothetical protein
MGRSRLKGVTGLRYLLVMRADESVHSGRSTDDFC